MKVIETTKNVIVVLIAVALMAAFLPGSAFAQDFRNPNGVRNGSPRFGIVPGLPVPNLNDPMVKNLVGSVIGGFLGYMVINNQYNQDYHRDNYYHQNYSERNRHHHRDHRYYGPDNRRYNNWDGFGYDRYRR
jgi:hypothetical protein